MSGFAQGNYRRIALDDISAGEIECCGTCVDLGPKPGERFFADLEYLRLLHADHQLSPHRWGLPWREPTSKHTVLKKMEGPRNA